MAFADWLDGQSSHRVAYARDGEPLAAASRPRGHGASERISSFATEFSG